jgi:hypothetical protein
MIDTQIKKKLKIFHWRVHLKINRSHWIGFCCENNQYNFYNTEIAVLSLLRVFGPGGLLALVAFNESTLQNRVSIKGPRARTPLDVCV